MKAKDHIGSGVTDDLHTLRQALRRMPVPELRPGFVDEALARAVAANTDVKSPATSRRRRLRHLVTSWEMWVGVAFGGAMAAALSLLLLHPGQIRPSQVLALTLHEVRTVDVLIDSERELKGATISIAASGSIILVGFEDEHEIGWRADLDRGSNLLSLPVVARAPGKGKLVAVIEHEGRTRRVAIDLTVVDPHVSQS
jgi:hypothetical protein